VEERIAQLERARTRLAERPPARRWIRVNIPSFSLEVIDSDRTVLAMPVVVGRLARPTPVFESAISSIVLHPAWTVPADLAYRDVVPKIRRDPGYLASRGFEVFAGADPDAPRLDPKRIDWSRVSPGLGQVTLRQRPGSGNGLGRFLFSMENAYDVYLHDTPSRELFRSDRRDFSSGCIRVADARALAREILRSDDATWSPARLDAALARGATRRLPVHSPVPVRVVYHTAWVDEHGTAHFREDIYGEDGRAPAVLQPAPARVREARDTPPRVGRPRPSRHAAAWPFSAH
jgi:murein L,D-transpeptidase YcbB/YkuD